MNVKWSQLNLRLWPSICTEIPATTTKVITWGGWSRSGTGTSCNMCRKLLFQYVSEATVSLSVGSYRLNTCRKLQFQYVSEATVSIRVGSYSFNTCRKLPFQYVSEATVSIRVRSYRFNTCWKLPFQYVLEATVSIRVRSYRFNQLAWHTVTVVSSR
jgi:hypothetical protein